MVSVCSIRCSCVTSQFAELAELESAVTEVMNLHEDSVVQIDLGPLHAPAAVRTLGRPRRLPATGPQIV